MDADKTHCGKYALEWRAITSDCDLSSAAYSAALRHHRGAHQGGISDIEAESLGGIDESSSSERQTRKGNKDTSNDSVWRKRTDYLKICGYC